MVVCGNGGAAETPKGTQLLLDHARTKFLHLSCRPHTKRKNEENDWVFRLGLYQLDMYKGKSEQKAYTKK